MKIHVRSISKALLLILCLALLPATPLAAEPATGPAVKPPPGRMQGGVGVELIDPATMKEKPQGVEPLRFGDVQGLRIEADGARTLELAVVDQPGIKSNRYLVKGWVRYDEVEGDAYLEMWNHFGEQAYFSRTLGEGKGPMQKMTGTSDWRTFLLPFNADEGMVPDRLEINLVLAGKGKVMIADVRLVDLGEAGAHVLPGDPWWTPRQAGWIGGAIGCLGAALGFLASALARRSAARSILLARVCVGAGLLIGQVAIVALVLGQPWHVWYLPALVGVLLLIGFGIRLPAIRRASTDLELRRMRAADA